jgi:SAM-dependent methyltransferase
LTDPEFTAEHYSQAAFEFEVKRLSELCPVEFETTKRMLDRWIPDGARIAEIGVGVGHYSEHLARRGCRIHLIDIAPRLLDAAVERLERSGLGAQIAGVNRFSATDLAAINEGAFDAVLALGPLYHLRQLADRQRAVAEAARLLKTGGLLYAAAINRLPYFRELLREQPGTVVERREFHQQFLRDGNLDPDHAPPLGFAHLTTVQEFREPLRRGLRAARPAGSGIIHQRLATCFTHLTGRSSACLAGSRRADRSDTGRIGAGGSLSVCGPEVVIVRCILRATHDHAFSLGSYSHGNCTGTRDLLFPRFAGAQG